MHYAQINKIQTLSNCLLRIRQQARIFKELNFFKMFDFITQFKHFVHFSVSTSMAPYFHQFSAVVQKILKKYAGTAPY